MRVVCVLGALVVGALGGASAASAAPRPLVVADADMRTRGPRIPSSFLGFSQEYNLVLTDVGTSETPLNEVLVRLYRHLDPSGNGPPVLRVGGGSTDNIWWAGGPSWLDALRGVFRPPEVLVAFTPRELAPLRRFLVRTGAPVMLGLNFGSGRPAYAADLAAGIGASIPRRYVKALEIGNEPQGLPTRMHVGTERGIRRFLRPEPSFRPPDYGPADYLPELHRFIDSLGPVRPSLPLAAPGFCCQPWLGSLPRLMDRERGRLDLISLHRYGIDACGVPPGDPRYPTPARLLNPDTVITPAVELQPHIAAARRRGLPVRISETNSVACGGVDGVSNTFASTLWGVDWLFALAAVGADGVNFHSSNPLYQPLGTAYAGGRFSVAVKPLYYAMLAFAEATANRARVLPATAFGQRSRAGANVRVWGVHDAEARQVRVVVIAKDGPSGGRAVIRVPGANGPGRLKRLLAPSIKSKQGITWGGQSLGATTVDGRLIGRQVVERVGRGAGDWFRLSVPAGSLALLTVPVRTAQR